KAFTDRAESMLNILNEQLGIAKTNLQFEINRLLDEKPEVTGSGIKGGQYVSNDITMVLRQAEMIKDSYEDSYLSLEHFMISLMEFEHIPLTKYLISHDIDKDELIIKINEMRGGR